MQTVRGFHQTNVRPEINPNDSGSEIIVRNTDKQVLYYKVDSDSNLIDFEDGVFFVQFDYENEFLKSISYFGKQGELQGVLEFGDTARMEFEIKDPNRLKTDFKKIEEQDKVQKFENKTVIKKFYNAKGNFVSQLPITSSEFWLYNKRIWGKP
ncbi:hypothetical protein [Leptospira perolatii]|nr:hypothetical protein [Leptospira perolatii]